MIARDRDAQVFEAICEHMEGEGGDSPKIIDLVSIVNGYEGLPNSRYQSVGNATISQALFRLEKIGLIEMRRAGGGKGKRSAGSLRIVDSEFEILISLDEANDKIAEYYEAKIQEVLLSEERR